MTPLDVVKQRVQLGLYQKPMQAFKAIIKNEGFHALYTSYFTTILMNVPNAAVLVMTNDWLKSILNPTGEQVRLNEKQKNHEQNFTAFLISGLIAGSLSGFVTCPLDVIKTRIQTQSRSVEKIIERRYTSFWQTLTLMIV